MGRAETARLAAALLCTATLVLAGGCAHQPARTAGHTPTGTDMAMPDIDADPGYQAAGATATDQTSEAAAPAPARTTTDLAGHMRATAPTRYVVRKGDTLWDIAGYYLDAPWYWPQLWHANPGIADPDLIYPGDVLVLTRDINGMPRLVRDNGDESAGGSVGGGTIRLSPQVRVEPLSAAIPVIPADAIRTFLHSPRRVDTDTLTHAPYVVALSDTQLVAGPGATVYLRGLPAHPAPRYDLVRTGDVYRDPKTGKALGRQAIPVGQVKLESTPPNARVTVASVVQANREVQIGDRLLPVNGIDLIRDFHPRTPAADVATRIISVYGGLTQIGQFDVVALDDNKTPRLSRGDVLDIYQAGQRVPDPVSGGEVELPERHAGQLMVFKNDGPVSYALVMRATRAIHVGDVARTPTTP